MTCWFKDVLTLRFAPKIEIQLLRENINQNFITRLEGLPEPVTDTK